jgi:hypothetical protein
MTLRRMMEIARAVGLLLAAVFVLSPSAWTRSAMAGEQDSLAAWDKIASVLTHPRCLNCHQLVTPRQGDTRRIHVPPVVRGADNMGAGTMRCRNCHSDNGNNEHSGVPGALHWQLAPVSMLWEGLSNGDLCRMLKDPARNGNRTPDALIEHMETEHLVLWGWNPGGRRAPVPMPHGEFIAQMKIWVTGDTACPP